MSPGSLLELGRGEARHGPDPERISARWQISIEVLPRGQEQRGPCSRLLLSRLGEGGRQ